MSDAGLPDTPIKAQTFPPPSRIDVLKGFVGDLARPYAIIVTSTSAAGSALALAVRATDLAGAAIFIGAVFAGVGGLYAAKSWENNNQAKQTAIVAVEQAKTTASTGATV